jgi:hypothetical protein
MTSLCRIRHIHFFSSAKMTDLLEPIPYSFWPDRDYVAELVRPWKLFSFAVGMAWLIYGAMNYNIPDWDMGVSLLMGGLTYVCAPWSVRVILLSMRDRQPYWWFWLAMALVAALFVVDWVYVLYHSAMENQMFRRENFYASSALYFLAGAVWFYRGSVREFLAEVRLIFSVSTKT